MDVCFFTNTGENGSEVVIDVLPILGVNSAKKHPYLTMIQIMLYKKYALQESLRELVKIIQM